MFTLGSYSGIKMSNGPEQEKDMKAKITIALAGLLLVLGLAVGCSKSAGTNDAQIIGQVATKIQADGNVQTKAIAIQSNAGVVTLSGQVATDAERNAAASDAAQVEGVKTVVNNLTVANAAATPAPQMQAPVEEPKPGPVKSSARRRSSESSSHRARSYSDNVPAPAPVTNVAQNSPAPVSSPAMPPPPPKPVTVTIPDGTQISIRLVDPLDSEKNQVGDRFRATVGHSIYVNGQVAVPVGADIEGRVVDVKGATHFTGKSVLAVELTNLSMGGKNYELHTAEFRREGAARGKNTAEKVGGGAALGAIIGAIAGGGKGAAIGATVGAGAGGGVNAATKGEKIQLPTESVLNFQLANALTVTPSSRADHNYNNNRPVLTDRTNNGDNNYSDNSDYSDNTDRPVLERRGPNNNNDENNGPQ
jgi:hypothetical protein